MSIFSKDLKQFFNNKRLILIICVILTMVCIFICTHHSVEYNEDANLIIGVANEDDSKYSDLLIDFFGNNDNFSSLGIPFQESYITQVYGSKSVGSFFLNF